jgi:TolB-like protein
MKRAYLGLACLTLLLACGCAQRVLVQPEVDVTRYNRLAVLPFETDNIASTAGNALADQIILDLLQQAPALDIVERTRIDVLLREQGLVRQGAVDPESAVSVGRMLGVNAILTGSMSMSVGTVAPSPDNVQRVATGTAIMRVIDSETGKIIWADRQESQYSTFVGGVNQPGYSNKTDQEMVEEVIKDLAKNLAQAFYPHYEWRY